MSASDRSWTIAPVLLWFCGCLIAALCVLDGGVDAIADRFRARREPVPAAPAGPVFTAKPVEVAEAPEPAAPASPSGTPGAPGAAAPVAAGGVHIEVENPPGTIVAADRTKIL